MGRVQPGLHRRYHGNDAPHRLASCASGGDRSLPIPPSSRSDPLSDRSIESQALIDEHNSGNPPSHEFVLKALDPVAESHVALIRVNQLARKLVDQSERRPMSERRADLDSCSCRGRAPLSFRGAVDRDFSEGPDAIATGYDSARVGEEASPRGNRDYHSGVMLKAASTLQVFARDANASERL